MHTYVRTNQSPRVYTRVGDSHKIAETALYEISSVYTHTHTHNTPYANFSTQLARFTETDTKLLCPYKRGEEKKNIKLESGDASDIARSRLLSCKALTGIYIYIYKALVYTRRWDRGLRARIYSLSLLELHLHLDTINPPDARLLATESAREQVRIAVVNLLVRPRRV